MRGFFGGAKLFALSILALAILAIVSTQASAEQAGVKKAESFGNQSLAAINDLLGILGQAGKAAKRLADPRQAMLIHVVDAAGKPIAGARVLSLPHFDTEDSTTITNLACWEEAFCHMAFTKADGTARIVRPTSKERDVEVYVDVEGYVTSLVCWHNEKKTHETVPAEFTFKLDRGQMIGGVVHDGKGQPVAGATLTLSIPNDADPEAPVQRRIDGHCERTDAQGRWRCSHMPLSLEGMTICIERDGYAETQLDRAAYKSQLENLQSQKTVFVLNKGLLLQGTITDQQGKPAPSARVAISQQYAAFSSGCNILYADADGRYRFDQCGSGEITISVAANGLVSQHRDIKIEANGPSVDFRLKPGRAVKIRVVDPEGKPLAGAEIKPETEIFFGSHRQTIVANTSPTDRNGRWTSGSEPEGEMSFEIQKPGYATVCQKFSAGDEEHRVTLRPPVRISGRIINAATREPIRKVHVSIKDTPLTKEPGAYTWPSIDVDREGRYELTFNSTQDAESIAWQLYVQSPGYVAELSRKLITREGTQTMDIELLPGPSVAGVVRRPDGTPVAGAKVFVSTASDPVRIQDGSLSSSISPPDIVESTGADGRFELPMPLEPYIVGVVHDFGGAEIAAQDLESRDEIVLQPWARVEGVVQGPPHKEDSDGKENISLKINEIEGVCRLFGPTSKTPYIEWTYSYDLTSSRRFIFNRVLPGRAEIAASASVSISFAGDRESCSFFWYTAAGESATVWRDQKFTTMPGQTSRVEFANKGRPVTGCVVPPSGKSRKGAVVGGYGLLVFQRPLVPVPPEIAKQAIDVRKAWEKRWLESEAGLAADRAAQDRSFEVAADGCFKTDSVAPGVYKLAVEFYNAGKKADETGDEIAWMVQEVTVPAVAGDKPFDLGKYAAKATMLFRGDTAPDFEFQTADGRSHHLSEYRGKKVILNFSSEWDSIVDRTGIDAAKARQTFLSWGGGGPLVWINLSSDTKPRPEVKMAQDADFQYVQGFVPPTAKTWQAYDVHRPRPEVVIHVAQDGKVIQK